MSQAASIINERYALFGSAWQDLRAALEAAISRFRDAGGDVHLIGDPPYEAHTHAHLTTDGKKHRTDGYRMGQALDFGAITEAERMAIALFAKKLAVHWILQFCTTEGVAKWRDALEGAGLRYHCAGIWDKTNPKPKMNGQGPAVGHECFVLAWGAKGYRRWNGGGNTAKYRCPIEQSRKGALHHPTQKPVPLMRAMIRDFTNPGDVVIDLTAGSGTTGVAALMEGRFFIGVERLPKYFALMADRLVEAAHQPIDMFAARQSAPPPRQTDIEGILS